MKNLVKFINENTGLLLRIDDIAENMNWQLMDRCELLFDKHEIKPLLGVIPNNQDRALLKYEKKKDFWKKVLEWKNKGWEISMHGYTHVYDKQTYNKDYFGYGGGSEFFGHSLEEQINRIKNGIEIFKKNNIKVRSFFAPNHTYDENTLEALKKSGISEIIDGYGLMPYLEKDIKFIPQLFYQNFFLPFGIQTTQLHLNYWTEKDFKTFSKFIENHKDKFITYEDTIKKINNSFFFKCVREIIEKILKAKRHVKKKL